MIHDSGRLRVAVVGAGQPGSAEQLLRDLPPKLGCAVVASSPLSPDAVRAASRLPVVAVKDRVRVEHDQVYVVPIDRDVRLEQGHLVVGHGDPSQPRLDAILRSIAGEVGAASVAIVLAGRGSDGALGIQRVKEAGGWTLVQEVAGEHGEMPRAAIATGRVDLVLPIDRLASRLAHSGQSDGDAAETRGDPRADGGDTLRDILALIRVRSGHDFAGYKRGALHRRIARRMQICGHDSIAAYHRHLRDDSDELLHLVRDFLIGATQFFRDRASFELLAREVVPRLFSGKKANEQLRVWVAGCATGGEAYSLGILLLEHAAQQRSAPQIQIFATDIDRAGLETARLACYPETIAGDVAPERLRRFFRPDSGQYRVCKELRDLILFSPHNLLRNPPFSRLDLISCRNVLVYLDREARNRVLTTFHFGLRPDAFLFLGASESTEGSPMFATVDAAHSVFSRSTVPASLADAIASGKHAALRAPDRRGADRTRTLSGTREQLGATIEQYRTALEELRASNDELRAINEELQTTGEELETGREEIESANQELLSVNQELELKIQELGHTSSDFQNLMTSTDVGVVFLDRDLRIKRFTPRAQDLFHLIASDVGRPLDQLTHRLDCADLWDITQSVLQSLQPVERELRSHDRRRFLVRWLPYRTVDDRIEGVVLTFVDVTDLRDAVSARERSEQALQQVEERLRIALRSAPLAVLGFDALVGALDAMVVSWGFILGHELGPQERAELAMFAPGHGERLRVCARQVVSQRAGQRIELDVVLGGARHTFDFRIDPTAFGATAVGFDITPGKIDDHDGHAPRAASRFGA